MKKQLILEEIFNSVTHGIGALLGIVALTLVILVKQHSLISMIGSVIFTAGITLAYLISTLFHSLSFTPAKKVFRILDHASIFLLIACSYTAFISQSMINKTGVILLSAIWIIAIWGIIQKSIWINKWGRTSILLYLGLGWTSILIIKPLQHILPLHSFILLCVGGIIYSTGIIFYLWKKLPFGHTLWHLCVLAATICHFLAIYTI